MDRPSRFRLVALGLVAVVVVAAVVLFFAVGLLSPPPAATTSPLPTERTYVNLTITYDAATQIGNFTTPFISMVAHTLVVVTITNYDPSSSPLFVSWDNHVIGTVGGNESVSCGAGTESVTSLPPSDVSHTWTVLDTHYNISIPIPPAPAPGTPCVVTFELTANQSEMTTWGCVADCDNGQMAAGRMWGLLLISG